MIYTQNAVRVDLATLTVNAPIGYIGDLIYPDAPVGEVAGIVSVLVDGGSVAVPTSVDEGSAPTGTMIQLTGVTFATSLFKTRYEVSDTQCALMRNDIAKIDEVGGKAVIKSMQKAVERAKLLKLADTTGGCTVINAAAGSSPLVGIAKGLSAIRKFEGEKAVVLNLATIASLNSYCAQNHLIAGIGVTSLESTRAALAGVLGVSAVLPADDTFLTDGGQPIIGDGMVYCVSLPSKDEFSYKTTAELGRTFRLDYGDDTGISIESYGDMNVQANKYTGTARIDVKEFNSLAKSVVDLTACNLGALTVDITGGSFSSL